MTKLGFTRLIALFACTFALVAQMTLTPAAKTTGNAPVVVASQAEDASEKISIRPVTIIMSSTVVPSAGSQLIRTKDGVFMTLSTRNLNPGWVYTAWWGIFNNPSHCASRPCGPADFGPTNPVQGSRVNAGGRIIGPDGSAVYSAFLGLGDTTGAFDGPGLLNPKHAEIHLVVRSHGIALMGGALMDQLTLFNGGCPPNMCGNVHASVHAP